MTRLTKGARPTPTNRVLTPQDNDMESVEHQLGDYPHTWIYADTNGTRYVHQNGYMMWTSRPVC